MKPPKDKRTKAYKQWKAKYDKSSKGLGDTVEKITTATGIKKAVKFLAGEDCGCDDRKELLNKKFNYNTPECFSEKEYIFVKNIIDNKRQTLRSDEVRRMTFIYNRVFRDKKRATGCSSCFINSIYKPIKALYETYK
tara:strand:+ start:199 stop:609 length:411 start_codon:yes stop_codon:yes gene_type:complete